MEPSSRSAGMGNKGSARPQVAETNIVTAKELILTEFFNMGDSIKDAILTIMKYIKFFTGVEPNQEEVAALLKSYFILNEVGNQIKYQLKQKEIKGAKNPIKLSGPNWKLNLLGGAEQNILARAGVFHRSIKVAIDGIRQHVQKTMGTDPGYDIIAKSLKSSFILSEIKNQLDYQRKQTQKP